MTTTRPLPLSSQPSLQRIWKAPSTLTSKVKRLKEKVGDERQHTIRSAFLLLGSVMIASATLFFYNEAFAQAQQKYSEQNTNVDSIQQSAEKVDIEKDRQRRIEAIDREIAVLEKMVGPSFKTIKVDGLIEEGDSHHALKAISARLAMLGDAEEAICSKKTANSATSRSDSTSDQKVKRSLRPQAGSMSKKKGSKGKCIHDQVSMQNLKNFQRRHGLKQDGVVGPNTLAMLNLSPEDRITRLLLSRERMDNFKGFDDDEYIFVNIPEYKLYYVVEDKPVFNSKVVVGKPSWATPVFSDELERFVVNPEWRIPTSITTKVIAKKVANDPSYLADRNMEIRRDSFFDSDTVDPSTIDWDEITPYDFDYFLVQKAGPSNPLGQIKYLFPNKNAVYIHDTQATSLFNKNRRAFSHGCIRIEKPFELALSLANRHDSKTAERIFGDTLESGETHTVNLKKPIPVHMVYWTAWVNPKGERHFRKDIYDRDASDLARIRSQYENDRNTQQQVVAN